MIVSILIFSLGKFKINETLITHAIAISHLAAISVILYAYSDIAGLTAWAVLMVLVSVSMCYFSNSIVLIYSFLGGIIWLIVLAISHPAQWTYIDMTDHIGRICIFVLLSGMALWVNKRINREIIGNHKKMLLIQKYLEELEIKNINLQKLNQQKDEFLANTTHELNTPLHGIIGILEPLLEGKHGPLTLEQQNDVSLSVSSAKRLSSLVRDILDFSMLKNKVIVIRKQLIDIFVLTDMVCKTFEYQV